jgi:1-acyl-sn-glycerol-3-phosphate acyltransferase
LLYWVFKWLVFAPGVRLLFRPWIEGEEHIPTRGAAILVSNHLSTGDTFLLPAMIRRRMTFPAKAELFTGRNVGTRVVAWFLRNVGQLPMDRSGGRASATSMDGALEVLANGALLGIYPEGTRSPDGRLYKGKTGVARLVLSAGVPVVPVGMVNSQWVPSRIPKIMTIRRPGIRIGPPLDFSAYAAAGNDRDVLRHVTDEIMNAVWELSGQEYVDAYASSVKASLDSGSKLSVAPVDRPGAGRPVPPPPDPSRSAGSRTVPVPPVLRGRVAGE